MSEQQASPEGKPRSQARWDRTDWILVLVGSALGLLAETEGRLPSVRSPADVFKFLFGLFSNAVIWIGILVVVRSLFARRWVKAVTLAATTLAVIGGVIGLTVAAVSLRARANQADRQTQPNQPVHADTEADEFWVKFTPEERSRFEQIVAATISDPTQPTAAAYAEFWRLIDKRATGSLTSKEIDRGMKPARERMSRVAVRYQMLFWTDARTALAVGRPTKSREREDFEKELLASGDMTEYRIRQNEQLIENIAFRRPVTITAGQERVFTAELIQQVADRVADVDVRLNKLFTPPQRAAIGR